MPATEKDNLHEAETLLSSSGENRDAPLYQCILHLIWEMRRLRKIIRQWDTQKGVDE